jgi:hypothetical protein
MTYLNHFCHYFKIFRFHGLFLVIIKVHIYEEREKHTLLNVGIIATPKLYVTLHI